MKDPKMLQLLELNPEIRKRVHKMLERKLQNCREVSVRFWLRTGRKMEPKWKRQDWRSRKRNHTEKESHLKVSVSKEMKLFLIKSSLVGKIIFSWKFSVGCFNHMFNFKFYSSWLNQMKRYLHTFLFCFCGIKWRL